MGLVGCSQNLSHQEVLATEHYMDRNWKQDPKADCGAPWEHHADTDTGKCDPPSLVLRNRFNESLPEAKIKECMALADAGDHIDGETFDHCEEWDVYIKRYRQ